MTNEEQKLREFADKWGIREDDEPTFDPHTENPYYGYSRRTKQCLSDLTALISENYYPKEFVGWMLRCSAYSDVPFREFTLKWNVNIGPDEWRYFTTDELFNYWKENEQ